jgi:hypothetical protein
MSIDRIKDYCYIAANFVFLPATCATNYILAKSIYLFAKKTFSEMNSSNKNIILALTVLGTWNIVIASCHIFASSLARIADIYLYGRNHLSSHQYRWTVYPSFIYPFSSSIK